MYPNVLPFFIFCIYFIIIISIYKIKLKCVQTKTNHDFEGLRPRPEHIGGIKHLKEEL